MNQIEKELKFALYGYQYIDYSIVENLNFQQCLQLLSNHKRYKTEPIAQSEVIRISEKIINMSILGLIGWLKKIKKS